MTCTQPSSPPIDNWLMHVVSLPIVVNVLGRVPKGIYYNETASASACTSEYLANFVIDVC